MNSNQPKNIDSKHNKVFSILIILSTAFSFFNITLNYFIIKSINLNINLGQKDIFLGQPSIFFKNDVNLKKSLKTNLVESKLDKIILENSKKFTIKTTDEFNKIKLKDNKIELQANEINFFVNDDDKLPNFSKLKNDEITLKNIDTINVKKIGGLDISESLRTKSIIGNFKNDLTLNSPTKNLEIDSSNNLYFNTKYSQILVNSLKNLELKSSQKIVLNSKYIQFKNIEMNSPSKKSNNLDLNSQVCLCKNGEMFFVSGKDYCFNDQNFCN